MSRQHTPYFNLVEALRDTGCPLCRLGDRAAGRLIEGVLYESVTDPDTRARLVAAHGFCPTHSERLVGHHDGLGSAIIYRSILKHLEEELGALAGAGSLLGRLRERWGENPASQLDAHAPCPACAERERATERALSTFSAHHQDPALQKALAGGTGFCLPHLRRAVATLERPALAMLLEQQQDRWAALHEELDELIRKYDHRFGDEPMGQEKDSWQRAIRLTAGEPGVF